MRESMKLILKQKSNVDAALLKRLEEYHRNIQKKHYTLEDLEFLK